MLPFQSVSLYCIQDEMIYYIERENKALVECHVHDPFLHTTTYVVVFLRTHPLLGHIPFLEHMGLLEEET